MTPVVVHITSTYLLVLIVLMSAVKKLFKGCMKGVKHHDWRPVSGLSNWWACGRECHRFSTALSIFHRLRLVLVKRDGCSLIQNIWASSLYRGSTRNAQIANLALAVSTWCAYILRRNQKKIIFIIFNCSSVAVSFFGGRYKIRELKFADLLLYAFWNKNNTYENALLAILAVKKNKNKTVDRSEEKKWR